METVKRIISYPLSIVFFLFFGGTLLIFHPLQWLGLKLGGKRGHRGMVNLMNLCLLRTLHALGVTFSFKNKHRIPVDKPLIIVSNHQSMFDIPMISWYFRKNKPKFISKIELGKGIPSISFNLRHGEHALIDRKDSKQSIPEISRFGRFIAHNNYSAVIFPEGTRSRNGKPKDFAATGLKILFKNAPNAIVVPITINNSWKLVKYKNFPMGIGFIITLETHEPIAIQNIEKEELLSIIEEKIVSKINT